MCATDLVANGKVKQEICICLPFLNLYVNILQLSRQEGSKRIPGNDYYYSKTKRNVLLLFESS